jgi:hypothetical protein
VSVAQAGSMGLVEERGLLSFRLLGLKVSSRMLRNDENRYCQELPGQGLGVGRLGHPSPKTAFLCGWTIRHRTHFQPRRLYEGEELVDLVEIVNIRTYRYSLGLFLTSRNRWRRAGLFCCHRGRRNGT